LEGDPLGGHLGVQGQLKITLAFNAFGCIWRFVEMQCKVTFNEVPHPLSLEDLRILVIFDKLDLPATYSQNQEQIYVSSYSLIPQLNYCHLRF